MEDKCPDVSLVTICDVVHLENINLKTFYMFFIYKKQINYNVQLLAEKISNINLCH